MRAGGHRSCPLLYSRRAVLEHAHYHYHSTNSGQRTALTVHSTCQWDEGLGFHEKKIILVNEERGEQLWSCSWYVSAQGGNKLHKGVCFCHKEPKMTFAHPVCYSRAFSGTNYYFKHQIHQCLRFSP